MCLLPQRTAIINSNLQIFTKNMSQAWYNHQNTRQLVPNCDYSEFQVQLIIDDDRFEVPFSKFYAEPYTMEKKRSLCNFRKSYFSKTIPSQTCCSFNYCLPAI